MWIGKRERGGVGAGVGAIEVEAEAAVGGAEVEAGHTTTIRGLKGPTRTVWTWTRKIRPGKMGHKTRGKGVGSWCYEVLMNWNIPLVTVYCSCRDMTSIA